MNWLPTTMGEVCLPTSQRDPARNGRGSFRYIDISGIDREAKIIVQAELVPCAEAPSRARKLVLSGDVLVSTVRPNLNAVAIVPEELNGEVASTGFCVLRANRDLAMPRYLFYRTQHGEFIDFLVANATGASYPAVTDGVVRRVPLPLPPLTEQSRIVEILNEADRMRCLSREADTKAARIPRALFLKMFGDTATNPMGFRKRPLGDLIKVKSGNFLPAKDMAPNGPFPVYGGNGINGHHSSYMFAESKIVIGRVGAYCGVVHYSKPKSWVTDNALYVSENFEKLDDYYLAAALQQANLNQYAGRAGQPLISGARIYPVEILVPPEHLQTNFSKSLAMLLALNDIRSSVSTRLDTLWNVLMSQAFSGQLTAKWRIGHMQELLAEMAIQARALNQPLPKQLKALS